MSFMKHKLITVVLVALLVFVGMTAGCTGASSETNADNTTSSSGFTVNVGSLKGPTSMGLVNFMEVAENNPASLQNSYDFTIAGTADELVPKLVSGSLDIALLPANLAATLYNRTNGGIQVLDINTLGVLYVVSGDDSLTDMQSLAGRTVLIMGKGTTPDYVFNYLLDQYGLSDKVTLEFKSEATEVAATLAADPQAVAVLPEPYVSSLSIKYPNITARISLTDAWNACTEQSGENSQLVTGVTVVRTEFAAEHPDVVQEFMQQQALSVNAALTDPANTAQLVVKRGILDDAQIAQQALARSNLVSITGEQMQQTLEGYLQVLYQYNADSVGGSLPGADFYYQ